jgi:hypothetical protein
MGAAGVAKRIRPTSSIHEASRTNFQSFYSRLLELKDVISLLPGDEEPLNEKQLKKSFYDGMPVAWRNTFMGSGKASPR